MEIEGRLEGACLVFRWLCIDKTKRSAIEPMSYYWLRIGTRRLLASRSGWVLAEVLIGTTILVVGILAIMAANIQTTKTAKFSDNSAQATYIAQQKIEVLKKTYDITTTPVDAGALATCATPSGIFTVECTSPAVTAPVSGLNLVPVSVKVKWTDAASTQENNVTLTTYYFYKN